MKLLIITLSGYQGFHLRFLGFTIEDKTFFTMGGASSHDIQGGILDKSLPTYKQDYKKAVKSNKPFRVLNESWWSDELPTEDVIQAGRNNLAKVG